VSRFYPEYPGCILVTATELTTTGQIADYAVALAEVCASNVHANV